MELLEAMKAFRSVRKYKNIPIPEEKLKNVLNAVRLAPSTENRQPWKFLILRDDEKKRKLATACSPHKFIQEAPMIIVGCALPDDAYPTLGSYMCSYPVDMGSAFSHLILAATSEGLGTCMIYNFSEDRVKGVLGLDRDVKIVGITPLGFPAEEPAPVDRKHINDIICYDEFK